MGCSRGLELAGVVIAMTMLAVIVVTFRFYYVPAVSDYDAQPNSLQIFTLIMSGCMVTQTYWGVGTHVDHLTEHHIERILFMATAETDDFVQWFYISVIFYNNALGALTGHSLVKISILLQYMHIFALSSVRIGCIIGLVWMGAFTLETTTISIFDCSPIRYFWDKSAKGGACVDFRTMWFCHAAINIVSDMYLIIVPMPAIVMLSIPLRQKIPLICAFSLGCFVTISSILRLSSINKVSESKDITYDNVDAAIWSCVELCLGIICASLPTFKAVLGRIFPSVFGSFTTGSGGSRNSGLLNHPERTHSIPTRTMPTRRPNTFRQYNYDSANSVATIGGNMGWGDILDLHPQEPVPRYTPPNEEAFRNMSGLERGENGQNNDEDSRQDSAFSSSNPSDTRSDPHDPRRDSTLPSATPSNTRK
ncbi:hypothetical protein HDK64DRAFT_327781 [Phyllosticta capitalensis]